MIHIAITKGRLEKEITNILTEGGYTGDRLLSKDRSLIIHDGNEEITYYPAKSKDVITYVEYGACDMGFVGKDTILENPSECYELADLKVGICSFVLASLPEKEIFNKTGHLRIGTKYPYFSKKYFEEKGMDVEIIKIDGSVELSPILGLCDGIVDIAQTGRTLKENGLVVFDKICELSARVIVNKAAFRFKNREIREFLNNIKAVSEV